MRKWGNEKMRKCSISAFSQFLIFTLSYSHILILHSAPEQQGYTESEAFCAKSSAALKAYLDKQVESGAITPAERKVLGR